MHTEICPKASSSAWLTPVEPGKRCLLFSWATWLRPAPVISLFMIISDWIGIHTHILYYSVAPHWFDFFINYLQNEKLTKRWGLLKVI